MPGDSSTTASDAETGSEPKPGPSSGPGPGSGSGSGSAHTSDAESGPEPESESESEATSRAESPANGAGPRTDWPPEEAAADLTFLDALCRNRRGILLIVALAGLFVLVSLPYLVVAEPGSTEYVLAQLNLLGAGGFTLAGGATYLLCERRLAAECDGE